MDSGVINFDDLPDDNPLPKAVKPQALGAISFDDLPDYAMPVQGFGSVRKQSAQSLDGAPDAGIGEALWSGLKSSYYGGSKDSADNEFESLVGTREKLKQKLFEIDKIRSGDFRNYDPYGGNPLAVGIAATLSDPLSGGLEATRLNLSKALTDTEARMAELTAERSRLGKEMANASGRTPSYNAFNKAVEAGSYSGQLKAITGKNPTVLGTLKNAAQIGLQTAAESAIPSIKTGAIELGSLLLPGGKLLQGAARGATVAASTGADASDSEKSSQMQRFLISKGVNPEDGEAIKAYAEKNTDEYLRALDRSKVIGLKVGGAEGAITGIFSAITPGGETAKAVTKAPFVQFLWNTAKRYAKKAGINAAEEFVEEGSVTAATDLMRSGTTTGARILGGAAKGALAGGTTSVVTEAAGDTLKALKPGSKVDPINSEDLPDAATPAAPAAPVAPQPINAEDLPSVAGETAEAPAAPAPVAVAPVQPVAPVAVQPESTPAPAPQPVATAQPEAVGQKPKKQLPEPSGDEAKRVYAEQMASDVIDTVRIDGKRPIVSELSLEDAQMLLDRDLKKLMAFIGTNQEGSPGYASYLANVRKLKRHIDILKSGQASAQPEAKPVAPVAPAAQTVAKQQAELGGMEDAFNLAGEQVAAPAEPVQAPTELGVERENPIAAEARARLMKLEAAGKGDSDQAKALRRTIERETQPTAPAPVAQAEAPAPAAEPEAELKQGDRFTDAEGKAWQVWDSRFGMVKAFPVVDGKISVNNKDGVRFATNELARLRNPEARTDVNPVKPVAQAAPAAEPTAGRKVTREQLAAENPANAKAQAEYQKRLKALENSKALAEREAELVRELREIRAREAQPDPRKNAEISPPQSTQAEAVPTAEPAVETAPVAEQPQAAPAKKPKAEPTLKEAVKAQKTDQPQTKRARTALAKAIRENGADDIVTRKKYRAVLRALEREGSRSATAKDVSQPYLGLTEPTDIKAARELLAKKAKKEGKIENEDARKAEILIEQYEAEVDLAQGQLRDSDQIKLVSDKTLNRVVEHVQGMLDDGLNPDADAMNAMRLAGDEIVRREQIDPESFGDPIADVKGILRKEGFGIPLLPVIKTEKGETVWNDTEYSGLQGNLPKELSQAGGIFVEPKVREAGIDLDRARNDATYRKEVLVEAEGMMSELMQRMQELGWTQLQSGFDIIGLLSDAADGKPQVPEGGVSGSRFKGDPSTVSKLHGGEVDLSMLASEGSVNTEQQNAAQPEAEPTQEERQGLTDIQAEYENPPFDSTPTPAEQTILDAASDNMPTEESILDALDKAAAERLDPKNRSSIGPDLIAALMWQTARDIQKGVVTFAKWAADKARQFPGIKGSLKTIWAKAQDIAKRPIDYIRFRALDTIADKVWQNVRRNKGSETLRKIANIVFAKGGPDADAVDNDIPTRVNLVRTQFSNIYASIMERFAADFADMTPEQRRQWDVEFRKHVIEGTTPADPKLSKAVKDYRKMMRDMLEYQRAAGIDIGDQGENYFPRHYDPDAVEADRPGFVKAAVKMYKALELRLLNSAIADVRKAEKERPAKRRDSDKKFGRKEKTDAEYRQEAAEWAQEKIDALEAEHDAKDDDYYQQKAEDWATAITHGDVLGLTLFKASDGKITSDATDVRRFNNDEAAIADAFIKKNVDDIMMGYIDGAVRGAELARVFGEDGKKFEQMMNQLSKEGVDAETVQETRRLVQKALGVGREQSSQAAAIFFDWVNVVLAGAFLGKTAIYNLVLEPISFGIRTGNVYLALKGMTDTWKYAIAEVFANPSPAMRQRIEAKYGSRFKFEKAVTETVGEQVGLIQREMERAYLNSHWDYSSGEKGSKLAKWISQRIYRANLMSATEKAKVQASIGIARLALRDNARFLSGTAPIQKLFKALGFDTNADKSAAVIMRENGVPDADHKAFAAFVEGLEGKTDAEWQAAVLDPKNKMAKHYRRALQRMSLGMSIKTNQSLKMEMSDSILGRMLMQLMNYSYAYSNLVKDRMYSMASETVAKDASKIDRLRYAAPLLVGAPLAILAAVGSKALISAMWPSDEMEKMNKKKAAARKGFDAASFAGMFGPKVEYLVKGFERGQTPGGPVAETVFRGGQAAFAAANDPESANKAYNAKKQIYSSTVKPLVTGVGAAVHPFFGFLGNAAVNKQETREAVIGEKPKK